MTPSPFNANAADTASTATKAAAAKRALQTKPTNKGKDKSTLKGKGKRAYRGGYTEDESEEDEDEEYENEAMEEYLLSLEPPEGAHNVKRPRRSEKAAAENPARHKAKMAKVPQSGLVPQVVSGLRAP